MAYATTQDAIDLYGETYVLTTVDRDGDRDPDPAALDPGLTQASSLIDSYLGSRYTLPLPSAPAVLVQACVDIAIYKWCADHQGLTEEKRVRYDDAIKWLKDVSKGLATLGPVESVVVGVNETQVEYAVESRLFSRRTLKGVL